MAPKFNPFRPGGIVIPGMFCGRIDELKALEQSLFQAKNGNPHHFLLHGERGIGKSSLLYYFQLISQGDICCLDSTKFKFITVNVELEPGDDYQHLISKVGAGLKRVVAEHERAKELAKAAWDFLKNWEVMGVKYKAGESQPSPEELLEQLVQTVERTAQGIGQEFDGIVILIDEADKPGLKAMLGQFLKVFTERMTKRGCNNVMVGLAGLSEVIRHMRQSHESSLRIPVMLELAPLLIDERKAVIQRGLVVAKASNGFETKITPQAEDWIAQFSEGYPHMIQQFASSAFEEDGDNVIDEKDVLGGAFKEHGAFHQLGVKYYHDLYFDKIRSDEYRLVLKVMSEHMDGWVTKQQIRTGTKLKPTILDNAITALRTRRIIIPQDGKKGVYRLPTKSFAVWIRSFTQGEAVLTESSGTPAGATATADAPPAAATPPADSSPKPLGK